MSSSHTHTHSDFPRDAINNNFTINFDSFEKLRLAMNSRGGDGGGDSSKNSIIPLFIIIIIMNFIHISGVVFVSGSSIFNLYLILFIYLSSDRAI